MRAYALLSISVLVACGGGHAAPADASHDAVADAAPDGAVDAALDAALDAAPDAPPMGTGQHYHYVIDHEYVPQNNTEARNDGLDLDGDGQVDNQLGMVFGTLAGMGFDLQATTNTAIDTGAILMLADLQTTDLNTASDTGFTIYDGANPVPAPCNGAGDPVCRHHLDGNGSFDIAATSPHDPPLVGAAVSGTFDDGPGHLSLELVGTVGGTIQLSLIGARVRLSGVSPSGIASGVLAGAISQDELHTTYFPKLQDSLNQVIERDCCGLATSPGGATCDPAGTPACGCTSNSTGQTIVSLFDTTPMDCTVSLSEVENNTLIQALFAPDVTIEGQPALSVGVGITAVGATFTP